MKNAPINGKRIRELRRSLGLTQEELAKRLECSERLIRGAENGSRIGPKAAIAIQAFFRGLLPSSAFTSIYLDHLSIATEIIEGYHHHGSKLVAMNRNLFHRDFRWTSAGDPEEFPFAGTFYGADAFADWLDRYAAVYQRDPKTFSSEYFLGNDSVVCHYTESYRLGDEILPNLSTFVRFVFDGNQVVSMEDNYDTQLNLKVWKRAFSE